MHKMTYYSQEIQYNQVIDYYQIFLDVKLNWFYYFMFVASIWKKNFWWEELTNRIIYWKVDVAKKIIDNQITTI